MLNWLASFTLGSHLAIRTLNSFNAS
jgi:hypothetical protein